MINTTFTYNLLTLNNQSTDWLSGVRANIDWIYVLTNISGLDDPALRDERQDRAAMDGQIDYAHLLAERLVTLRGKIIAASESDLVTKRQNLEDAFIKDGNYHWLTYQLSGQAAKQVYCKVFSKSIAETYSEKYIRPFLINLIAIDPHIYSQEELIKTVYIPSAVGGRVYAKVYPKTYGTIQVGGKITCTNNGNYPVIPIVKMYGPLSSPKIRNNDDDAKEILINLVVADGDYLEIDFLEKTILLNGTASRYNYLSLDSQFWKLKMGNNSIEFRDGLGNVNGKCEIIFRSGWI